MMNTLNDKHILPGGLAGAMFGILFAIHVPSLYSDESQISHPTRTIAAPSAGPVIPSADGTVAVVLPPEAAPYILDCKSGDRRVVLELSEGLRVYEIAFASRGDRIVAAATDADNLDNLLVWSVGDGKLVQRALIPKGRGYVNCLRSSATAGSVFTGMAGSVLKYDIMTNEVITVVPRTAYRVLDLASHDDTIAYIDQNPHLNVFSVAQKQAFKHEIGLTEKLPRQPVCVDWSDDGREVCVASIVLDPEGIDGRKSEVCRFDVETSLVLQRLILPRRVLKSRYVRSTRTLFVEGPGAGFRSTDQAWFGFLRAGSSRPQSVYQVNGLISGASMQASENGHLTVGLVDGSLLQWSGVDNPLKSEPFAP